MHFIYFLKSVRHTRSYIGVSEDVDKRLIQHNSGYTKSTKPYRPWKVVYVEQFETKQAAMKREWHLKHPAGFLEKKTILEQNSYTYGGVA